MLLPQKIFLVTITQSQGDSLYAPNLTGAYFYVIPQIIYLVTITHQRSAEPNKLPFSQELIFMLALPKNLFGLLNMCCGYGMFGVKKLFYFS